ncbi:site-specific integrase [Pseudoramibacter porci]|uniref:Site-specific integrase n=1 Tax=Pseudoramibacter porci TaxID=2606631 RepID=A0A7X2TA59_9FIRM|nr:site-specific integrase [Pseudoramibacter porci]MSS19151.1 site-specific integrase [Pseudoramibacter porci]
MSIKKDDKTGLYTLQFYYRDHNGKRHHPKKTGFKRKKDAEAYHRDFMARVAGSSGLTFKAVTALYLKDVKARVKPTTYANKKTIIKNHLLPHFSDVLIDDITPAMIRDFQTDYMLNSGLKGTTLHLIGIQLNAIFNFAVKFYGLEKNPGTLAGSMGTQKAGRMDFYTPEEFNKVLSCVDDPTDKTLIYFLFWSGCRIGEALALTWNDFDLEENSVSITKNYQMIEGREYISTPKTPKSKRIILLPQFVIDRIKEYKGKLYGYQPDQRLFKRYKEIVAYRFHKAADLAGVRRIRLHDLRHSHASMLINLGASPLLVAARLGHDSAETTLKIYSHLFPDEQEKIRGLLENFCEKIEKSKNI